MATISPVLFLIKEENLLKWNPSSSQIQYPVIQQYHYNYKYNSFSVKLKISSNFKTLAIKCLCNSNKNDYFHGKDENPFEVLAKSLVKALKSLQKPAATALFIGFLLMYDPNSVFALTGGRMGGSSFSSSSRSSSSKSSSSMGGSSFSSSSRSSSSKSSSSRSSSSKSSSSRSSSSSSPSSSRSSYSSSPRSSSSSSSSSLARKRQREREIALEKERERERERQREIEREKERARERERERERKRNEIEMIREKKELEREIERGKERIRKRKEMKRGIERKFIYGFVAASEKANNSFKASYVGSLPTPSPSRIGGDETYEIVSSVGTPPSPSPSRGDGEGDGITLIILCLFISLIIASNVDTSTERPTKRKEKERKSIDDYVAVGKKANNSSKASYVASSSIPDTEKTTVHKKTPVYEETTVLKLQVGLLKSGRSLQTDLNWIAETADTSTSVGLHYILTETILSLRRHSEYCISTYSSVDINKSMEEGEKRFNRLSTEERAKFDEETLVNVNNKRNKQSSTKLKTSTDNNGNEFIVVTILVAVEGEHKLPSINNNEDLQEALKKLASISSLYSNCSRIMGVEVLWAPQEEDDILSETELLESFPLLKPL